MLEDNQVLVQGMMANRYMNTFRDSILSWNKKLMAVADVVQILVEIQRTWAYLESLFIASEEVKKELPEATERFAKIDADVKKVSLQPSDAWDWPCVCKPQLADGFGAIWLVKTHAALGVTSPLLLMRCIPLTAVRRIKSMKLHMERETHCSDKHACKCSYEGLVIFGCRCLWSSGLPRTALYAAIRMVS